MRTMCIHPEERAPFYSRRGADRERVLKPFDVLRTDG